MDRQQQLNEINKLTKEELQAQFDELCELRLPPVSVSDTLLEDPGLEEVKAAKEKALEIFESIGAAVGITRKNGKLALAVRLQHIPSDTTKDEIQALIDANQVIDGIAVDFAVSGIAEAQ